MENDDEEGYPYILFQRAAVGCKAVRQGDAHRLRVCLISVGRSRYRANEM